MEPVLFASNLLEATRQTVQVARRYVTNRLPDEARYFVRLRKDVDGQVRDERAVCFFDSHGIASLICDLEGVMGRLCVNGAVPVWIDMSAEWVDDRFTYLRLSYSGRFSADERRLRYTDRGYPPFQWGGCIPPPHWNGPGSGQKFDLRWVRRWNGPVAERAQT